MNSSGIKRGLASSAIAALAVTGLPFLASSASADSLADSAGVDATLLSPNPDATDSQDVSIKNDGQNSTVSLVANAPKDAVRVEFAYDGKVIGSANRDANGQFALEWTPLPTVYNTDVTITATAYDNADTVIGAVASAPGVNVSTTADSIELNSNPSVGYYEDYAGNGHAIVSGTTSALTGTPTVTTVVNGAGTADALIGAAKTGDTSRAFKAAVSVDPTKLSDTGTGAVNQFAVRADTPGTETSDAQAYNVYEQTVSGLSASADQAQTTTTTDVTVTVTDQNGKAVAGVPVKVASNTPSTSSAGTAASPVTDANGQVVFADAEPGTHRYYADEDNDGIYDGGTEYAQDVTIGSYTATPDEISFSSKDGNAFDIDENAAGDLTVKVVDQNGNGYNGAIVNYSWDYVPFNPTTSDKAQTYNMPPATTGTDGVANINLPSGIDGNAGGTYTLHAYVNRDTTPGQGEGDLALAPQVIKTGESDVAWDDVSPAQRPAGTTQTFTGDLELADGTTLGGRDLKVNYDGTADSFLALQADQPAGTKRTGATTADVTTGSDGAFGVAVTDPKATTQADEKGNKLQAVGTGAGVGIDADETLMIDFLVDAAPASVTLADDTDQTSDTSNPADTDGYDELIDNEATPGRPVTFKLKVTNKADGTGTALANQAVTLTTDHGFFVKPAETADDLVADPAPAEGDEYGSWKDASAADGSYTVMTDDQGVATVTIAIGRDEAFDKDGTVTSNVTAKVGNVTNSGNIAVDWSSLDALNGDEVEVSLAKSQTVEVLPKAPTSESVNYDVFARDQFGNLTNATVKVSSDLASAMLDNTATDSVTEDDSDVTVASEFLQDGPAISASSGEAGDMTLTATWNAPSNTWTDGNKVTDGFQAARHSDTKTVTDESSPVSWYVIDYAASTYTLTHTGADTQPVGTTVTETYTAVDQNGEPLSGYDVTFYRTGPDDLQDGDGNSYGTTNDQGEAYYVFQGAKAGDATITATLREQDGNGTQPTGDLIPQGEASDEVSFGGTAPTEPKVHWLNLSVESENNGPADDELRLNANWHARGLVAQIFRKTPHGKKKLTSVTLNRHGNKKVTINDTNRGKFRTYIVRIKATVDTHRAQKHAHVR